ncbi:hypothetical protein GCM10010433_50180 [Streptomyces pulveraceus]|uniref:hypothetical protein n=1 Tax=Streptomyces pulveraceus TaxID=68258 RepID=UPI00338CB127
MEKFVPKYRNGAWSAGGVLYVYVCPRAGVDDELLELAQRCRSAISEYPIDPQYPDAPADPGWLHLTVEMIADTPTAAISDEEKRKLVSELTQELSGLPGFGTEVGPPIGNVAGCVLDVWPEDKVRELGSRVWTAVVRARGEDAIQHSGGRPHMSIGYYMPRRTPTRPSASCAASVPATHLCTSARFTSSTSPHRRAASRRP